jgi:hypothetical protein
MWINGFHLGRYWETQGPQHAFYVPGPVLVSGANDVVVFEQEAPNADASVTFGALPDFTGAACGKVAEVAVAKPQQLSNAVVKRGSKRAVAPVRASASAALPARAASAPVRALRAIAPAPRACAAPYAGMPITLQSCTAGSAPTAWTLQSVGMPSANAGAFQLSAATSLCLGVNGTNPTTGSPNIALVACDPTLADRSQHFMYFNSLPSLPIMSLGAKPGAGTCFDCEGGSTAPGTRIELYGCTGGANQAWAWSASAGTLTSSASGLCLAAC